MTVRPDRAMPGSPASPSGSTPGAALMGLRGVAALIVVAHHILLQLGPVDGPLAGTGQAATAVTANCSLNASLAFDGILTQVMKAGSGHVETHLYRDVANPSSYLIVSEWGSRKDFGAFISSDAFRAVTDWGRLEILSGRPTHQIYDRSEPA